MTWPNRVRSVYIILREQFDYEWSRDAWNAEKLFDGESLQGWTTTTGEPVASRRLASHGRGD